MKIAALETWYGGSHKQWLDGLIKNSKHSYNLYSMKDSHWKWRMQGGSLELATQFNKADKKTDLILASSMVDLSLFDSLAKTQDIPKVIYFHENQFAYPVSDKDTDKIHARDQHYAFVNLKSALIADELIFNSKYNKETFLSGVKDIIKVLPDYTDSIDLEELTKKSKVIPLGFDLDFNLNNEETPVILWNHRFEYDKNPDDFFNLMIDLQEEGFDFKLIVLGEGADKHTLWRERLKNKTIHWGKVEEHEDYLKLLERATLLPVTSHQDFFGISIVEAISKGAHPLLPNRLAYPELIPQENYTSVFYEDISTLREMIKRGKDNQTVENIQRFIKSFEWKVVTETYDKTFTKVLKNNS